MIIRGLMLGLLGASAASQAASPVPVADFARHMQYRSVKISPDGEYIATDALVGDKRHLSLIHLADKKVVNIRPRGDDELATFTWVGPRRVIYTVGMKIGGVDRPQSTGELFGVDADGSANDLLYGFRLGGQQGASKIKHATGENASATIIDTLVDDDDHILISTQAWDSGVDSTTPKIFRFDVKTGKKTDLGIAPMRDTQFVADNAGVLRFAFAVNVDNVLTVMYRESDKDKWEEVFSEQASRARNYPLGFDRGDKIAYWTCSTPQALGGVCTWSGSDRSFKPVWTSNEVEFSEMITSLDGKDYVGVRSEPGRDAVAVLDKSSDAIQTIAPLMQQFPGETVYIKSASKDGNHLVISVESDVNPGEFYLLDRKAKKLTPLLKRASWIDPDKMATMEPIALKSRDGLPLHGYITRPVGQEEAKNLPLVVYVHGGPIGVRDHWGYDDRVQLLASRGYAVLQVNYRGSGGYGREFETAGYREWGGKMRDDVTDATKWAIEQGFADPKRVCIYGVSYGGYAALDGAVKEPDLYRCAIGDAGVYDLRLMYTRGDIEESMYGERYLKRVLGEDEQVLVNRSPISNLASLKAKVMIVVGGQDKRVPPVHGQNLHIALEKRGIEHEYVYERTEGHGFYDEANATRMYEKLLAFLDRNIGAGAASSAKAASGTP